MAIPDCGDFVCILQYIDLYYYGPEVGHIVICVSIHISWHGSVEEYHFVVASQNHLSDSNQLREQCRYATCSLFWPWAIHVLNKRLWNTYHLWSHLQSGSTNVPLPGTNQLYQSLYDHYMTSIQIYIFHLNLCFNSVLASPKQLTHPMSLIPINIDHDLK